MNSINVNGQNGVATSANVNVNGYYNVDVLANRSANHISKRAADNINVCGKHFIDYSMVYDDGKRIKVIGCVKIAEGYKTFYVADDAKYSFVCNIIKEEKKGRRYVEVDNVVVKVDDLSFADLQKSLYNAVNEKFILLADEQVVEQENEDIDYLVSIFNEKMEEDITKDFESTLQTIAEYGDHSGENEYVCGGFNYERDYENEWVEFYNENGNGGINHAYEIFRNASDFTYVDFFNEDSACDLVYELGDTYGVGVEDNCCEDCLVWVKNPYYNESESNAPCLDIDIAVDRVVNTIKSYLANYTPSYLDQFGECVITIDWDNFSEKDMQMLIEDDVFEGLVIDSLVGENISDMLVYDDGVYVTVDYDKMFNKVA